MDEDQWVREYGLRPVGAALDEVRSKLTEQIRLERRAQGDGDTLLMKLCCVQLFNAGGQDDVLLIWQAKTASFDADCSIDIQLLCGGGLDASKAYLSSRPLPEAEAALSRLLHCERSGDFEDFSVERYADYYDDHYAQ
ncbi:hypothetical protein [Streptomyces sp. NPDC003832]